MDQTKIETNFFKLNGPLYASDEVGRGPLAGPVVAATVKHSGSLADCCQFLESLGVNDSKKISVKKRKQILKSLNFTHITKDHIYKFHIAESFNLTFSISEISEKEIDKMNILNASLKAMSQSFLVHQPTIRSKWLIDGNKAPETELNVDRITIVKGDSRSYLIGLASLIAKEYRDLLMAKLALIYPYYDFEKNAGYPTKKHLLSIKEFGISPFHRLTFKGVKEYASKHAPMAEERGEVQ